MISMATARRSRRFLRSLAPIAIGTALFLVLAIGTNASVGAAVPPNVYAANGCPVGNVNCLGLAPYAYGPGYGQLPAGGQWVGNRYYYRDNRYCGDGNLFFQNGGYFCADGVPVTGYAVPVGYGAPVGYIGVPVAYYGTVGTACADARFVWTPDRGCVWRG
jgi:hypothetical protein